MKGHQRGFTIVELLIVIVVIAVLSVITIVAFNNMRTRSQAAAIATDLRAIEKAMFMYKDAASMSTWIVDTDATAWTGTANPSISSIIATQPAMRDFMKTAPVANGLGSSTAYAYDNDLDTYNGCSAASSGVNIYVANATNTDLMQAVDSAMDDGNLSCGRVRLVGTSFHYNISRAP
ncbi:MAG: prepilin-type N-terminal cleavage/methylation domain-containing protein [Candidatus Saccharimonas sp.]